MRKLLAAKGVLDPSEPIVIKIPRFQRGLVWEDEKKRNLIDSLIRRYPVGSLLVSEVVQQQLPDGRPLPVYQLIDGLQRTEAIAEHLEEPLARIPRDAIPIERILEFRQALEGQALVAPQVEELSGAIEAWFHKVRVLDLARGFTPLSLIRQIDDDFGLVGLDLPRAEALDAVAARILEAARQATDIGNNEIPVLVYAGDQSELPEIFARLNRQGTTLSKYQIFAAAWVDDTTAAATAEIRQVIETKYQNLKDEGFEVEDRAVSDPTSVSLFEYLYGLSRYLNRKFPTLLRGEQGDGSDAFSLATLVRAQRLDRMDRLPSFVAARDQFGRLDPAPLEKALVTSTEFVKASLAPFLGLQLSQVGRPAHGELQIVSMIAAVCAARYDSSGGWTEVPKSVWRARALAFKKALPQHYLLDLIRQTWRGPLYSLAYDRVWDTAEGKPSRSSFYLSPPAKASWEGALSVWFEEQLSERQLRRPNITALERTLLRYVYSDVVTVGEFNTHRFDVDHLFPVSRLAALAKSDASGGWPIGSLANLALIDVSTNRRRKDETIPEYFSRPPAKKGPSAAEQGQIRRYLLANEVELSIPTVGGSDALSLDAYVAFLKKRWQRLVTELYRSLGI
jgi:Protein of unknown function DUF262